MLGIMVWVKQREGGGGGSAASENDSKKEDYTNQSVTTRNINCPKKLNSPD